MQIGSQEWKTYRRTKIGGSDAPIIMGVSPWTTPFQLWEQKVYGTEAATNSAMQRGIDMEEEARQCFERKLGVNVFPKLLEHPKFDWMIATMDGIDLDHKIAVEIKCGGSKAHEIALQGKIPDHYYPQLQHQMEVCGLDGMYYFSFDGNDGIIIEIQKDSAYSAEMLQKEAQFNAFMREMVEPPLSDKDYIDKNKDLAWQACAQNLLTATKIRKAAEQDEERLKDQLKDMAAYQNARGGGIQITKSTCKGAVDYTKIPELKGVDLEKYRKGSITKWRFSENGEK